MIAAIILLRFTSVYWNMSLMCKTLYIDIGFDAVHGQYRHNYKQSFDFLSV